MKKIICVLVLRLSFGAILGVPLSKPDVRIINGDSAEPGQFPFIVGFVQNFHHICDGSIINNKWIITAASCVDILPINQTAIVAGTNHIRTGGDLYNVSRAIYHPDFNYTSLENDIALIEVKKEIKFHDLVQPIEFGDVETNGTVTAAGWGIAEDTAVPDDLRYIELRALSLGECQERAQNYMGDYYLGPEQVCTLSDDGSKGICYRDYGGPLIHNGKLVGIISNGFSLCAKGAPDVYTRPTAYIDWINSYIKT